MRTSKMVGLVVSMVLCASMVVLGAWREQLDVGNMNARNVTVSGDVTVGDDLTVTDDVNVTGTLTAGAIAGPTSGDGSSITNINGASIASGNIGFARVTNALNSAASGTATISTNIGLWGMTAGTPTDAVNTNLTAPISIPVRFNGTNYYIRGYLTSGP